MRLAGIMTGTSLDAMDLAICTIRSEAGRESITLDAFWSAPYPDEVRYLIFRALRGEASMKELSAIPYELATAFARELRAHKATVDAIGVHGQTLWHDPPRSTWQAVSGPALAVQTATPVVHDFRSADVALGGQGAPLVPMFDLAFLHSQTIDRVAVNIGGMANCTLLPKDVDATTVRAFDTGPGNVLIDAACRSTFGKRFDEGGSFARAGRVIDDLLKELQQHPFFSAEPPKSTGREVFNDVMV
jgi:anhydro-N-acetylmuramic acid kinase